MISFTKRSCYGPRRGLLLPTDKNGSGWGVSYGIIWASRISVRSEKPPLSLASSQLSNKWPIPRFSYIRLAMMGQSTRPGKTEDYIDIVWTVELWRRRGTRGKWVAGWPWVICCRQSPGAFLTWKICIFTVSRSIWKSTAAVLNVYVHEHESSLHNFVAYLVTLYSVAILILEKWKNSYLMRSSASTNQGSWKKRGNIRRSIFTETSNVLQISEMLIDGFSHPRSIQDFGDYEVNIQEDWIGKRDMSCSAEFHCSVHRERRQ